MIHRSYYDREEGGGNQLNINVNLNQIFMSANGKRPLGVKQVSFMEFIHRISRRFEKQESDRQAVQLKIGSIDLT